LGTAAPGAWDGITARPVRTRAAPLRADVSLFRTTCESFDHSVSFGTEPILAGVADAGHAPAASALCAAAGREAGEQASIGQNIVQRPDIEPLSSISPAALARKLDDETTVDTEHLAGDVRGSIGR
jgi:hypothetical protein